MLLKKCSCPSFVAPSLKAIMPASLTQTAFSTLRAIKLVHTPRKLLKVHIIVHRHLPGVDLENSSACGLVWKWEFNLPIRTAGPEKGRVKNIDTVRCSDDLKQYTNVSYNGVFALILSSLLKPSSWFKSSSIVR